MPAGYGGAARELSNAECPGCGPGESGLCLRGASPALRFCRAISADWDVDGRSGNGGQHGAMHGVKHWCNHDTVSPSGPSRDGSVPREQVRQQARLRAAMPQRSHGGRLGSWRGQRPRASPAACLPTGVRALPWPPAALPAPVQRLLQEQPHHHREALRALQLLLRPHFQLERGKQELLVPQTPLVHPPDPRVLLGALGGTGARGAGRYTWGIGTARCSRRGGGYSS